MKGTGEGEDGSLLDKRVILRGFAVGRGGGAGQDRMGGGPSFGGALFFILILPTNTPHPRATGRDEGCNLKKKPPPERGPGLKKKDVLK